MRISHKFMIAGSAVALLAACGGTAETADPTTDGSTEVMVEEDAAPAMGTVVETAQGNPDFSTLVSAVTAAGLVETLSGPGPFTIFAPSNAAFDKVDKAALGDLMQPDKKDDLAAILTYHVVPGKMTAADLDKKIAEGGGSAVLTTIQGGTLTATKTGDVIKLTDANGTTSTVYLADLEGTNGVIHAIDTVVMPKA